VPAGPSTWRAFAERPGAVRGLLRYVRHSDVTLAGDRGRPQGQRLLPPLGLGAQMRAHFQAVQQHQGARSRGQPERFRKPRRGLGGVASPQFEVDHDCQALRLEGRGACLLGRGQYVQARLTGRGEVAHPHQAVGQVDGVTPGYHGGNPGRVDLLGLPQPAQFSLPVTGVARQGGEVVQRSRLPISVAEVAGHGQGAMRLLGRLGRAGGVPQRARPPV
jgi:hypothetical protein